MAKFILFDFDGTIADSFDNFIEIVNTISNKYHLAKIPPNEINALRSEDAKTIFRKLNIPLFLLPFIAWDVKRMQRKEMVNIKPFKDLPEMLIRLKQNGYKLGILTSNGEENVFEFLKLNNIDVFEYIYDNASLFGKEKSINKFIKNQNISKNDLIYVGDEIRDIHACKKAGVKIISVSWGFNSKEGLEKNNPDYIVDSPIELSNIIKSIN